MEREREGKRERERGRCNQNQPSPLPGRGAQSFTLSCVGGFISRSLSLSLSLALSPALPLSLFPPRSPAIGRTLIPRYFSTVFEGGVTELYFVLKHSKESFHSSTITLDCDQCSMITQHGKPMFTKV